MAEVVIVVPVLNRPGRAAPLVEAAEATEATHRVLFMCSPADAAEIQACRRTGADVEVVEWDPGAADYARKANRALAVSDEPWIFVVGDDTCFCPGWDRIAIAQARQDGAGVVGTNDRGNPRVMRGETATANLVARWYAEEHGTVEARPAIFHEGYDHNFVDDELVETAKARGSWTFAVNSWVPHDHPNWTGGEWDSTYAKGHARFTEDQQLFWSRRPLWSRLDAVTPPALLSQ